MGFNLLCLESGLFKKMKNLTVSEIRFRDKQYVKGKGEEDLNLKYNLWGRFVLREVAYYLVWPLLKLGISANLITSLNFLVGCVGCLLIAFGNHIGMIAGALLVNFWALVDYADGQVARWNNSSSNYGRFLDNLTDTGIAALLFVCLGVGVFSRPDPYLSSVVQGIFSAELNRSLYLFLGGWASICYLYSLLISYNFERLISPQLISFVSRLKIKGLPVNFVQILAFNLHNVTGIIMPVLLLGSIFKFLSIILGLWALISTGAAVFMGIQMITKARADHSSRRR